MNRRKWMMVLAEAPPHDVRSAEVLGSLLVEWAYGRLRRWYGARFQRDPGLQEELDEVVGQFLTSVTPRNFECLEGVPVDRREAYLGKSLQRCVARHFAREKERKERVFFLADCQVGEGDEEHELDANDLASTDPNPEDRVIWKVLWEEVLTVVGTMPASRGNVFHDRYMEGMTA